MGTSSRGLSIRPTCSRKAARPSIEPSHETGHLLGLVSEEYLGGAYGYHNNNTYVNGWIMNDGSQTPYVYDLGSHSNRVSSWRPQNIAYLEFILPKEKQ
jgi:hypothetical protein